MLREWLTLDKCSEYGGCKRHGESYGCGHLWRHCRQWMCESMSRKVISCECDQTDVRKHIHNCPELHSPGVEMKKWLSAD